MSVPITTFGFVLLFCAWLAGIHFSERRVRYCRLIRPLLTAADQNISSLTLCSGRVLPLMLEKAVSLKNSAIERITARRYAEALHYAKLCDALSETLAIEARRQGPLPPPFPPTRIVSEDGLVWLGLEPPPPAAPDKTASNCNCFHRGGGDEIPHGIPYPAALLFPDTKERR